MTTELPLASMMLSNV